MTRILHGVVHGKTIELESDPGLKEGCAVEIELRDITCGTTSPSKVQSAAGMVTDWSDEDDRLLEEIHSSRKTTSLGDSEP